MTSLVERMREAADTLEEASKRYGSTCPDIHHWDAAGLRGAAEEFEAKDERAALVEELARHVYQSYVAVVPKADPWDSAHEGRREHSRVLAKSLIESGWRKEVTA